MDCLWARIAVKATTGNRNRQQGTGTETAYNGGLKLPSTEKSKLFLKSGTLVEIDITTL
jgi:hypothetical protein